MCTMTNSSVKIYLILYYNRLLCIDNYYFCCFAKTEIKNYIPTQGWKYMSPRDASSIRFFNVYGFIDYEVVHFTRHLFNSKSAHSYLPTITAITTRLAQFEEKVRVNDTVFKLSACRKHDGWDTEAGTL